MKRPFIFTKIYSGAFLFFSLALGIAAENPFAEIIRKTAPLTPDQEQKTFHLPPGFAIELVASEPQISKPMNLDFDAKGRLWMTQSREYPFPVLPIEKKGRDKIQVLENFDLTGRAQKISTFADGLNIPIGIYPYKNGALAFSIPTIYFFQDTNGDGIADKQELFLGRFGFEKDTHGLTGHFRRGFDGWLYADHGFNNDSTLTAKDGSTIKLNSGNTYRIKIDGSHLEQFTWGQVNPFGLMFDPLGDLWSSDCHSSPLYLLTRGAHLPSFGKVHDGLGYAPNICEHSHGSTAIAGMVFYAATNFPAQFRNNTFIGNVMTCRINRDSFIEHGSTRIAKEEPDFLTCDDPWFRPVDLQLGPDGALYVADFYNRIIGHYEVPLTHPGRDRERGRIWRIVYKGERAADILSAENTRQFRGDKNIPTRPSMKTSTDRMSAALSELGNANITRRMLAMNEITDRIGQPAIAPIKKMMRNKKSTAFQKIHGLWILQRLDALDAKILSSAANDFDRGVRVHALRVLSEIPEWTQPQKQLARAGLRDSDAYVQRAAADAFGQHPALENVPLLLELRERIPVQDTELLYVARMALRNQLIDSNHFSAVMKSDLTEADSRAIADVAVGVKNSVAGQFLLAHIQKFSEERTRLTEYLRHIVRYAESGSEQIAAFTEKTFADDIDFQVALFKSVQEGAAQRGSPLAQPVRDWGERLAEKLLLSIDAKTLEWRNSAIKGGEPTNPWFLQVRESADGDKSSPFFCSFPPGGEKLTGILKSRPFTIPSRLSFFMAGHDGSPDKPPRKKNLVRLRAVETQEILASSAPPRNDIAQLYTWDLAAHAGKKGSLEIVDGNGGHSYAWIAVGRFDPSVVSLPKVIPNQVDQRQQAGAQLAGALRLTKLAPQLSEILNDAEANRDARAAAAKALAVINPTGHLSNFKNLLDHPATPEKVREKIAEALAEVNSAEAKGILVGALPNAPRQLQMQISLALANNLEGAEALLESVENGKVSARLLQENSVRERLGAKKNPTLKIRLETLVAGLTPLSVEKQKLIDERRAKFFEAEPDAEFGAKVFTQNCAVCHQLDKEGALVGPQLDGVGNRGADRLIEDILDPNRNVDRAFRTTLVVLKDGDVQSGLFRREEGEMVVLADSTGKETSIPKKEIKERRESESSLMPDNFSDVIAPEDFNNLIAFLISKGTKVSTK